LGKIPTLETRKKLSISLTGKNKPPFTKEHKEKISYALSKRVCTEETRQKRRMMTGEKSSNWKGGISKDLAHYERARRNLELNAVGSHTKGEWEHLKALYNWTCPCCWKKEPEITLHQDHIVPLTRKGTDNIENIQPLCKSCNSRKKQKTIKYERR
jgi:5-methylcytosine-specific restriction endonuclease McrA